MSTQNKNAAAVSSKKDENPLSVVKKNEPAKVIELTPLEQKLQSIKQMVELQNKHTRLVLSSQKLDEFRLQKGEENISLTLEDDNNRKIEFSTKNPEVINAVLYCLRTTIDEKRKDVELRLVA